MCKQKRPILIKVGDTITNCVTKGNFARREYVHYNIYIAFSLFKYDNFFSFVDSLRKCEELNIVNTIYWLFLVATR